MERRSIQTLLSQGAAGGGCGAFLINLFLVALYSNEYDFILVILFPIGLVISVATGAAAGFVIWISEKIIKRNLRVPSRIVVSFLSVLVLSLLQRILLFGSLEAEPGIPVGYLFVSHVVFAIPIGMLAASRVRPWRLISRGFDARPRRKVLFRKDSIRISRTIQELKFSFLTGLPLRVTSLLGLMLSLLATASFLSFFFVNWRAEDWELVSHLVDDFIQCVFITVYFAATVLVSFTPLHPWRVLGMAFVLHVPLVAWIINNFGFEPLNNVWTFFTSVFIGLWLLFITGLFIPTNQGPLQVEHGHTEIRFGKQQWVKESL